jgi:SAM-dependent methyltransferase
MKKPANEIFDSYADDYDAALAEGISISGENKDYFARRRIEWLRDCLAANEAAPEKVMDYGCGTGSSAPHLLEALGAKSIVGTDRSAKSLEIARKRFQSERVRFVAIQDCQPTGGIDLAFCNGVFHHIPPARRAEAVDYVLRSLRPGGIFAFWENNPWNPGTRYVMNRIPFDRDAVRLSAPQAKRLLRNGGFEILRTDFLFIFPKLLDWFRWIEPHCSSLPVGAQYQVLCRKPR